MPLENNEDSLTPPKNLPRTKSFLSDDEDKVDSDIEDLFLDCMGEIQEASIKLNQTLSSRSLGVQSREHKFDSFSTPLDTDMFQDAADTTIKDDEPLERT